MKKLYIGIVILVCAAMLWAQPVTTVIRRWRDLQDTPSSFSGEASKVVRVNAGETALEFASSSVAYDDIADPDAAGSISFDATETATYTSAAAANNFFKIEGTGAFGDYALFTVEQKTGNPTNGALIKGLTADAEDDVDQLMLANGTDDYLTVRVVEAGTATIDIVSDGTPSLVINDTTSFNDQNITNVGQIDVDTVDADGAALAIGDSDETVAIDSSDWDIDATGIATGMGNITSDGTIQGSSLTDGTATMTGGAVSVSTEVYGVGWDADLTVPTKDAVYDKIEALGGGGENLATTLGFGADAGNIAITSLSTVDFFDAGIIIDGSADGVLAITSDGTLALSSGDWAIDATGIATNMGNITSDGTVEAATLTEGGVAVHNNDEMDASSELAAIIDDETGTGLIVFNANPTFEDVTLNAAGVKISDDADGAITFLGLGDGADEDLTLNFDDTADQIIASSSTGVTILDLGTIDLGTDAIDVSEGNVTNVGEIAVDKVDADGAALALGDNDETVAIDSSDWDIGTTGVMTGIGNITTDGIITFTGGTRKITTAANETVVEQTGDTYGASSMEVQNRFGSAGAVFKNAGLDLVDFGMVGNSGYQSNLRYEHRADYVHGPNNTLGELQFNDDATNIGDSGTITWAVNLSGMYLIEGDMCINTETTPTANGGGVLILGLVDANSVTLGADTAGFYCDNEAAVAEMMVMDEADNETTLSPHNPKGEWEFFSRNTRTGREVKVNMEAFIKDYDRRFGTNFFQENKPLDTKEYRNKKGIDL